MQVAGATGLPIKGGYCCPTPPFCQSINFAKVETRDRIVIVN